MASAMTHFKGLLHQFKDSKCSWHKIESFRGATDLFGTLKWSRAKARGHFGAKKVDHPTNQGIMKSS